MSFARRLSSLLVLATLLGLSAVPAAAESGRLQLVATTGMIADTLRRVGGERVEVRGLMGEGVDPHLYRQTRSDVTAMTRADAVFWNGLYLEAQLEEFLERLGRRKPVFAVGEAVPAEKRRADEEYPDQSDPHVWMDPGRWRYVVLAIRDALGELAPEHAEAFAQRADDYLVELEALDAYAREVLASVPEEARVLVTLYSGRGPFVKAVLEEVKGSPEIFQWLPVGITAESGERRTYWILHFPEPPDLLDHERTEILGGTIGRMVLDSRKAEGHEVMPSPDGSTYCFIVSSSARDALEKSGCTGMQFRPIASS